MIAYILLKIRHLFIGGGNKIVSLFVKKAFAKCGRNVHFSPLNSAFSYRNISIGNYVYIGPHALFSSITHIEIGNKVIFGPCVTIMGGNHNFRDVGIFMFDNHKKRENDDLPVRIEDDVWIGCNVTILKGVTIGRGAVVGAGSIVTKSIAPYAIVGGNPAKIIRFRFTNDEIKEHERILGLGSNS